MYNRLTNIPRINRKPFYEVNGHVLTNHCCAKFEDIFLFVEDIEPIFYRFHRGEESLETFLKGEFAYVRPLADITPLYYDPFTGKKIDWEEISNAILNK